MRDDDTPPAGTGESISRRGEDIASDEEEAGRVDQGTRGVSGRPSGGSTARHSSGIDPQEPIDADSPNTPQR